MTNDEIFLKKLRNLRKKWRTEATKQAKLRDRLFEKHAVSSAEKSNGMWIGYGSCAKDLDRMIREMEMVCK